VLAAMTYAALAGMAGRPPTTLSNPAFFEHILSHVLWYQRILLFMYWWIWPQIPQTPFNEIKSLPFLFSFFLGEGTCASKQQSAPQLAI